MAEEYMMQGLAQQQNQTLQSDNQADIQLLPLQSLFERLHTSEAGLTSKEAAQRLNIHGPNDPTSIRHGINIQQLLVLFLNPLVIILLIASIVSAILGDPINASIIAAMVILGVGLNFAQTYRSQRAVERLRAEVAPTAMVLRDGAWVELPRRVLVPGDIIRLSAGALIPADARLIQADDLHVQQAALTGESMPTEKTADQLQTRAENPAEAANMVFLGTSVVSGSAT